MSDRSVATLYIGGNFPRHLLPDFLIAAEAQGFYEPSKLASEEDVLAAIDHQGYLRLCDWEARNGEMEELEDWLRSHGIQYDRYTDACSGAWGALVTCHRGTESTFTLPTDEARDVVAPAQSIVEAYRALCQGDVHAALDELQPYALWEVPTMPPFTFVDE